MNLAEIADSIRHCEMIDVRSATMYAAIRISGSQNIPLVNAWGYINVLDHKEHCIYMAMMITQRYRLFTFYGTMDTEI